MNLTTIAQASVALREQRISPVELLQECLGRIERLNPSLNAFITVTAEAALEQARRAEREILGGGWRGPLHGIPMGLKDLIDTAGIPTTAASRLFRDRLPAEDAAVVSKLKAGGAVLVGKHNLHEFAYGASSLVSYFGPVKNPVDPASIAGGSSGGSAAAVRCGMCLGAIGTDTAGSIREPAALCGLVGLKPTFGLVSTQGIIPLAPSLDHVGPITATVEDAAIVLDGITDGPAGPGYRASLKTGIQQVRVGVPRRFFFEELDREVRDSIESALERLAALGARLSEIDLEVPTDRTLQSFESYAWHRTMILSSPELYQPETLRRLRSGEAISEDEYRKRWRELKAIRAEIAGRFQEIDVVVTPTTPVAAPPISALAKDPSLLRPVELVLLRNTRPFNLWGLPAISVPCGSTGQGLPIGLQIAGAAGEERKVLQAAFAFEQAELGG